MSSLAMEEISPVLAKGKFSHMPMPGIDFTSDNVSVKQFLQCRKKHQLLAKLCQCLKISRLRHCCGCVSNCLLSPLT